MKKIDHNGISKAGVGEHPISPSAIARVDECDAENNYTSSSDRLHLPTYFDKVQVRSQSIRMSDHDSFMAHLPPDASTTVLVVGAGPSGLMLA
jgi:hypothetical protein